MDRITAAYEAAVEGGESAPSLEGLGLSPEELAQYRADLAAERRPPLELPLGVEAALAASASAGLLAPVTRGDGASLWFVHRWTARAIAELAPDAVAAGHAKAARFWQWQVARIPQSREQDIEQLTEARFHHHAAGDTAAAVALTEPVVHQLQTWGHYGRATELCRQTMGWVDEDSREAAQMHNRLGQLALVRGDHGLAEASHRRAISILESVGDEGGAAINHANLAIVARRRGDYDGAEEGYLRAIGIQERIGDELNASRNYGNLGNLAWSRGATTGPRPATASPWRSKSASATGRTRPTITTTSVSWPSSGATTTRPRPVTASPWRSANAWATRRG